MEFDIDPRLIAELKGLADVGSSRSFKVGESSVAPDGIWPIANEESSKGGEPGELVKGLTLLGENTWTVMLWISYYSKFEVVGSASPHRLLVPEMMSKAVSNAHWS